MSEIEKALWFIDPSDLTYEEWMKVGMALKSEGFPVSLWEEWSRQEPRFKNGECEYKWSTFEGTGITAGTIFHIASMYGYQKEKKNRIYDWQHPTPVAIPDDPDEIDPLKPKYEKDYRQMIEFLDVLFDRNDFFRYVIQPLPNQEEKAPGKGIFKRKVGEIIDSLETYRSIEASIGSVDEEMGGYVGVNSLKGSGVKDFDVADFRYCLVESDEMPLHIQRQFLENSRLPIATLVYSGGKSIHALVRIDAENKREYHDRVEFIYEWLESQGFKVDTQNKNPARLSRLPGIMRNGKMQTLLATNIGCKDFKEWKKEIDFEDGLPEIVNFKEVLDQGLPPVKEVLIDGILRIGHKLIISAKSKAGKTMALVQLAACIAEGEKWFGHFQCKKGKILYLNFEVDDPSFWHRVAEVYQALGFDTSSLGENFDVWNLRGYADSLENLVGPIIEEAREKGYVAIFVDPIYKVMNGDENSAGDMAAFCRQFDKLAEGLDCSIIFCHHHSKGAKQYKDSMNRGSGSTVLSRDPDAILDLSDVENKQDLVERRIAEYESALEADPNNEFLQDQLEKWKARRELDLFVLEGTLREFPSLKKLPVWYIYPIHEADPDSMNEINQKKTKKGKTKNKVISSDEKLYKNYMSAFETLDDLGLEHTVKNLAKYLVNPKTGTLGITEQGVRKHIKENDFLERSETVPGKIILKKI